MVEHIQVEQELLAILLRTSFRADGIKFFTPNDFSQQLAYMNHPQHYSIPPHVHNPVLREVNFTKEVLFVKSGKVRVDFYLNSKAYCFSKVLNPGDVILLANGGHGFVMLEPSELIEVKQGPYTGELDKTRFSEVLPAHIKII